MARVAECLEKYGFEVLEKYEFNYQPTKELDQLRDWYSCLYQTDG